MKTKHFALIAVLTGTIALMGCGSDSSGPTSGGYLEGVWTYSWTDETVYLTFTGSNFNYTHYYNNPSDTVLYAGTFSTNTTVTPKNIDFMCTTSTETSDIGKTALGIYQMSSEATQLTLETSDFGDTVRPTTFSSDAIVLNKQ